MKALKLIGILGLVWVLAACGSVESPTLETEAIVCSPFSPPSVSCPWGTKDFEDVLEYEGAYTTSVAVGPDNSVFANNAGASSNGGPAYIRKYNKYGSVLWTIEAGGGQLVVDAQGNLYALDSTDGYNNSPYRYEGKVYLKKYSSAGQLLW